MKKLAVLTTFLIFLFSFFLGIKFNFQIKAQTPAATERLQNFTQEDYQCIGEDVAEYAAEVMADLKKLPNVKMAFPEIGLIGGAADWEGGGRVPDTEVFTYMMDHFEEMGTDLSPVDSFISNFYSTTAGNGFAQAGAFEHFQLFLNRYPKYQPILQEKGLIVGELGSFFPDKANDVAAQYAAFANSAGSVGVDTKGILLFNALGTGGDSHSAMVIQPDSLIHNIFSANTSKAGIHPATGVTGGGNSQTLKSRFPEAVWTYEIIDGNTSVETAAMSVRAANQLGQQLIFRPCHGGMEPGECRFEDSGDLVAFIEAVSDAASGGEFWVVIGPNEPTLEHWLSTGCSDKDNYYLYPIKGINSGDRNLFYEDLVAQGYQAYCAAPELMLKGVTGLNPSLDPVGIDRAIVEAQARFDYENSESPLWRKELSEEKITLFDSYETYWGLKDLEKKDPLEAQIASAPIYSLLTRKEQCEQKISLLETIEKMCNQLQKPNNCALDTQVALEAASSEDEPESDFTTLELLNAIRGHKSFSCENFASNNYPTNLSSEIAKSVEALPLYLNGAYRLGFLVITTDLMDDPGNPPNFNFLNPNEPEARSGQDVRVIAFRLPDTGTNKDPESEIYYHDGLELTRDALQSKKGLENFEAQVEAEKQINFLSRAGSPINPAQNTYYQESALVQALVDFVNNRLNPTAFYGVENLTPKDTPEKLLNICNLHPVDYPPIDSPAQGDDYELFDQAGLTETKGADTTVDVDGNLVNRLQEQNIDNQVPNQPNLATGIKNGAVDAIRNAYNFLATFSFTEGEADKTSKIHTYVIIPQGYELASVEETLAGIFLKDIDKNKLFTDVKTMPPFLKLQGSNTSVNTLAIGEYYAIDLFCQVNSLDPANECPKIEPFFPDVELDDNKSQKVEKTSEYEPRILGGRLGFLMRGIQQSLQKQGSKLHNYFAEGIHTTEEYLLGLGEGREQQHKNLACSYNGGYPIKSTELKKLLVQVSEDKDVPLELLNIITAGENCRFAGNTKRNICIQSDSFFSADNYLEPRVTYPHSTGCPAKSGNYPGIFGLFLLAYPNGWGKYTDSGKTNVCAISDMYYAVTNILKEGGMSQKSSPQQMKDFMIKFVLGTPNVPISCQSAINIANSYEGDGNTIICDVKTATGDCVLKEWLQAVGAYCCAVDKATGATENAGYCTSDPWVQEIEKMEKLDC